MKLLILVNIWKHRNMIVFVRGCVRSKILVARIRSCMRISIAEMIWRNTRTKWILKIIIILINNRIIMVVVVVAKKWMKSIFFLIFADFLNVWVALTCISITRCRLFYLSIWILLPWNFPSLLSRMIFSLIFICHFRIYLWFLHTSIRSTLLW